MKRIIFVFFVLILSVMPVMGYTLKGGVTYTVETAREEAFANVEYKLPQEIIDANKIDPNFKENKKAIKKGKNDLGDRHVSYYSNGGYSVLYWDDLYHVFYYSDGELGRIERRTGLVCPTKAYKYNVNNELEEIIIYVSTKEGYVFDPSGQLLSHWIGNKAYDLNGKLIMKEY